MTHHCVAEIAHDMFFIANTFADTYENRKQYGNNMRLELSLPFNNQLSLSSLAITGKLQEGCQKAEQRLPIDANCCNGR